MFQSITVSLYPQGYGKGYRLGTGTATAREPTDTEARSQPDI